MRLHDTQIGKAVDYEYNRHPINEYKEMLRQRINYLQEHISLSMDEVSDDETKYALGDVDNLMELIKHNI